MTEANGRGHGLGDRLGTSRRYRLTARGLKLGVRLVKLRTRLFGLLVTLAGNAHPRHATATTSEVDVALDHRCTTLGLKPAA